MDIALQEPGAHPNGAFEIYGGWGVIDSGTIYFDEKCSALWDALLREKLKEVNPRDSLLDVSLRNNLSAEMLAVLRAAGCSDQNYRRDMRKKSKKREKEGRPPRETRGDHAHDQRSPAETARAPAPTRTTPTTPDNGAADEIPSLAALRNQDKLSMKKYCV